MQIIPIKTSVLVPPKASLQDAILASSLSLQEGDVVAISSKVIAIDEGRCIDSKDKAKAAVYESEADLIIPRPYWKSPLTAVNHAFISAAGIDESNGDGYLVLLPRDPFASAKRLHAWLTETYGVEKLGVVVTDSHSVPFRYGAMGVAISWWGIEPLESHIGKEDIFGRTIQVERSNIVDGLAAAATVVMGETAEQQPIAVLREVPNLTFTRKDTKDHLFCPFEDDTFRVLYERWL